MGFLEHSLKSDFSQSPESDESVLFDGGWALDFFLGGGWFDDPDFFTTALTVLRLSLIGISSSAVVSKLDWYCALWQRLLAVSNESEIAKRIFIVQNGIKTNINYSQIVLV